MANTNPLYRDGHPLRYTTDCTRAALLYVAGRFMAVRIDYCGKRQASRYKRQASSNKQASS